MTQSSLYITDFKESKVQRLDLRNEVLNGPMSPRIIFSSSSESIFEFIHSADFSALGSSLFTEKNISCNSNKLFILTSAYIPIVSSFFSSAIQD
jgi:hypothetical protein